MASSRQALGATLDIVKSTANTAATFAGTAERLAQFGSSELDYLLSKQEIRHRAGLKVYEASCQIAQLSELKEAIQELDCTPDELKALAKFTGIDPAGIQELCESLAQS